MLKTSALLASLATAAILIAPAVGGAQTTAPSVPFGGSAYTDDGPTSSLALLRHSDGRVEGRLGIGFQCKAFFPNVVVKLAGTLSGENFTATGSTRLAGKLRLKVTVTGTFAGEQAAGTLQAKGVGGKGCKNFSRKFLVKADRTPTGAPSGPPANGTFLGGLSSQTVGGLRMPVMLQVRSGATKVVALWQAVMKCGPKARLTAVNFTPATKIAADGSFTKSEKYTIKYGNGSSDTYRVSFGGRFLADGASGTLRVRMQTRQKGKSFYPCDSSTLNWTATAATP